MTGSDTRSGQFEDWDEFEELVEDSERIERPAWRRHLLILVAAVTAVSLAIVPLYNVLQGRTVADNGLEVCGFDYCVVQDAVREAGLSATMSRLSNTFADEEEARRFADDLTDQLGVPAVGVEIVDELDGRIGGVYQPSTGTIRIERPARAWTILHEVAHVVEGGHGEAFRNVVIELTTWLEQVSG